MMINTISYDCLYIEVASVRHPKIGNADLGMVALISAIAAIGTSGCTITSVLRLSHHVIT